MVLQLLLFLTKEETLRLQESVICLLLLTHKSLMLTTRFGKGPKETISYSQPN